MSSPEELFNDRESKKIVYMTIKRMFGNTNKLASTYKLDPEDIQQMALMGLWNACVEWNPEGGRSFKNFAISRIRWEINKGLNRETKVFSFRGCNGMDREQKQLATIQVGSMEAPIDGNEEDSCFHDIVGNGYNLENHAMSKEYAKYIEENVNPDILEMIKMKSKNKTLAEIGKKFGLSGERVRQKIVSVRKQLENTGWEAFN